MWFFFLRVLFLSVGRTFLRVGGGCFHSHQLSIGSPMKFTDYVDDNIPFREAAIDIHNGLYLQLLHESPSKEVILGKDGWLFYAGDDKWFVIKDLVGHSLFLGDQLEKNAYQSEAHR
jgi:hypothetical protein